MGGESRVGVIGAFVGAVALSGVAVADWVVGGVPEGSGAATAMAIVHAIGYLLLLPAMVAARRWLAPSLGRVGRIATTVLVISLAAMVAGFAGLAIAGEIEIVALVAGLGFLGMFLGALVLGISAWRRRCTSRLVSGLLVAPLPLLASLAALDAVGIVPMHPALMEAAVYLGIATLGSELLSTVAARTPRQTVSA